MNIVSSVVSIASNACISIKKSKKKKKESEKEVICRKKSGGHRASNKNIRRSSYRKVHQLYILLSFDSVRALEIRDVASATSCIACAIEMRSSNGRERP